MSAHLAPVRACGGSGPDDGTGSRTDPSPAATDTGSPGGSGSTRRPTTGPGPGADGPVYCRAHGLPGPCAAERTDHAHVGRHDLDHDTGARDAPGGHTLAHSAHLRGDHMDNARTRLLRWARVLQCNVDRLWRRDLRTDSGTGNADRAGDYRPPRRDTGTVHRHPSGRVPGLVTR